MNQAVKLRCLHCAKPISERIAQIKAQYIPNCVRCQIAAQLYSAHLGEALARIEQPLAESWRKLKGKGE